MILKLTWTFTIKFRLLHSRQECFCILHSETEQSAFWQKTLIWMGGLGVKLYFLIYSGIWHFWGSFNMLPVTRSQNHFKFFFWICRKESYPLRKLRILQPGKIIWRTLLRDFIFKVTIKIIVKNQTKLTNLWFLFGEKAWTCVKTSVPESHNVITNLANRVTILVSPQLFIQIFYNTFVIHLLAWLHMKLWLQTPLRFVLFKIRII